MSIEILKHYIITSLFFFIGSTTLNQVSEENSWSDRFEIWLLQDKTKVQKPRQVK